MFIAVDLKVVEGLAGATARASGIPEDAVLAGLTRLWHRCWADGVDTMEALEIAGLFATNDLARLLAALVAFGFLAPDKHTEGLFRVRGASRYLRLKESRKRGAEATNQKRWGGRSRATINIALERPGAIAQHRSCTESPNTEHRDTEKEAEEAPPPKLAVVAVPVGVTPPTSEPATWLGEDFWRWAQAKREKAGFLPQAPPGDLSRWWSGARMAATTDELQRAFYAFGDDPHWLAATPPLPFAAFQKQWPNFIPRRKPA